MDDCACCPDVNTISKKKPKNDILHYTNYIYKIKIAKQFLTVFLLLAGPPPRDQGPRLLCPCDSSPLRARRGPASLPLLHHPLTVEGQGGPPLSPGPAAMSGWGGFGKEGRRRRGRGRGFSVRCTGRGEAGPRSLLLITDQYPD